ncbi:MAG: ribonuclease H-like domain-containing protein [Verrucomicrobiales bacterium]
MSNATADSPSPTAPSADVATTAQDFVYFDLETQRTAADVGGWNNKGDMRMSVGVTYSSATGKYIVYGEDRVSDLIAQLSRADLVLGYNHINFDYAVLEGYHAFSLVDQCVSCDLMVDLEKVCGHRPKLESVASASLGTGKTAQGLDAIKWWREGKFLEVAEYCCYDVKVTKLVHEYGARNGFVKYHDRFGNEQQVEIDWSLPV